MRSSYKLVVLAAVLFVQVFGTSARRIKRDDEEDFRKKYEVDISGKCTKGCQDTECCAMYSTKSNSKFSSKWWFSSKSRRSYKCATKPTEGERCSVRRTGFLTSCNECAPGLHCNSRKRCERITTTVPITSTVPTTTGARITSTPTAKPSSFTNNKCDQACQAGYCCAKTEPESPKSTGSDIRDSIRTFWTHVLHNKYSCAPMNVEGEKCDNIQAGFTSSCGCGDGLECGTNGMCVRQTINSTQKTTSFPQTTTIEDATSTAIYPTATRTLSPQNDKTQTKNIPKISPTTSQTTKTTTELTSTTPEPTTTPKPTTTTPEPTTSTPEPTTTTPEPTTTTPEPTTTTPEPTTTTPEPTTTTPEPTTTPELTTTRRPTTTLPTRALPTTTMPDTTTTAARTRPTPDARDRSTRFIPRTTLPPRSSADDKCEKVCQPGFCCASKGPVSVNKTGSAFRDTIRTFWAHVLHKEFDCAAMSKEGEKCDKVQNGFASSCGCAEGLTCGSQGMCVQQITSSTEKTTTTTVQATTTTPEPSTTTVVLTTTTTQAPTTTETTTASVLPATSTAAAAPQCAERDALREFCVEMRDAMATMTIPTVERLFLKHCDQSGLVPSLWSA